MPVSAERSTGLFGKRCSKYCRSLQSMNQWQDAQHPQRLPAENKTGSINLLCQKCVVHIKVWKLLIYVCVCLSWHRYHNPPNIRKKVISPNFTQCLQCTRDRLITLRLFITSSHCFLLRFKNQKTACRLIPHFDIFKFLILWKAFQVTPINCT